MVVKDEYSFISNDIPIKITVYTDKKEFVPIYDVSISAISKNTEIILEKIRQELITQVNLGMVDIVDIKKTDLIEERFKETIGFLISKYFPDVDEKTMNFLKSWEILKFL
jgi:hypothetical protein